MAQKDREEAGSRRRRKKGPKKPPVKVQKKKKSPAVTFSIIAAVVILIWAILPKEDDKGDSSKTVPAVVGILDQVYMGCTVYWYQKGSQYACTQEIVDKLYSSKSTSIKITVTEGKRKDFSAVGQHNANPMILRVDSNGEIYIKAKQCETNINLISTSNVNLEELEAKCTAK
jgi:hypothetical protein